MQISGSNAKRRVPVDAKSPTVSTESVMITAAIDAHEGHDVQIYNIPGDFIIADMGEDLIMALHGSLS